MNKRLYILLMLFCSMLVNAEDYSCSDHKYKLSVEEIGFEHVNHSITLNDKVSISKLEDEMWFIEKVKCTSEGFKITASHIQYNEPSQRIFNLIVKGDSIYTIE